MQTIFSRICRLHVIDAVVVEILNEEKENNKSSFLALTEWPLCLQMTDVVVLPHSGVEDKHGQTPSCCSVISRPSELGC